MAALRHGQDTDEPLLICKKEETISPSDSAFDDLMVSIPSNVSAPTSAEWARAADSCPAYLQKQRAHTYQPHMGDVHVMQQATARHLAMGRFHAQSDIRRTRWRTLDLHTKYQLDRIRDDSAVHSPRLLTKEREFERLNFDRIENEIAHLDSMTRSLSHERRPLLGLLKWFACVVIGFLTGICMVVVKESVDSGQQFVWELFQRALESGLVTGFLTFWGCSMAMACVAAATVICAPWAAGRSDDW